MSGEPAIAAMIDARRADSEAKRTRVLAALERMRREGLPITFASVAREAEVSTWLVYAPGVREAIAEARADRQGTQDALPAGRRGPQSADLAADLAHARAEITTLRAERETHQRQLRQALGARLDNLAKKDLADRADELTSRNRELDSALRQQRGEADRLAARVRELEDDLAAARTSLRRMIRSENVAREP